MAAEIAVDRPTDGKGQPRPSDGEIARLAEAQHGVVARRQLLAMGLGRGAVDSRLAEGRLHLVHRGVYAVGHRLLSRRGRRMAAVLAVGPDACLSHRGAAAHWGILRSGRIEVTAPRALRPRPGIQVHRAALPSEEITLVDNVPTTVISRTLFDLAAVAGRREVERAAHEADYLRLHDRLSLVDMLDRHPGRRGSATLRAVAAARRRGDDVARLELEHRFQALVSAAGLPPPELNAWVLVGGRRLEADCIWRSSRLMVELDGWAAHGTRRAYERDRARDRLLLRHGWRVLRITWRQLSDEPGAIAADLRALLLEGR